VKAWLDEGLGEGLVGCWVELSRVEAGLNWFIVQLAIATLNCH
jgi:hypothetical protein